MATTRRSPARRTVPANRNEPDFVAMTSRLMSAIDGISPYELADRIGVSYETVRRYARGDRPSVEFLARAALMLDLSLDWIVLGRRRPVARAAGVTKSPKKPTRTPHRGRSRR
ncbi:MAG: helix-turn-helix domain-containing protein [Phycisphaeraceae bacterium]|nr:helix-turn-helix domain-containing protein [Phycisphaeraceae bacterium]